MSESSKKETPNPNGVVMTDSISMIGLSGVKREKQLARDLLAVQYSIAEQCKPVQAMIDLIPKISLRDIDRKVKYGNNLTFEEAFCGMTYVLAATNKKFFNAFGDLFSKAYGTEFTHQKAIACGSAFLQLMAMKECSTGIVAEEIAGIAAASMIDLVVRFKAPSVIETCGMGGDRGFNVDGKYFKSINASTLSSLVLSGCGIPAIKHGSYGNTSAVGSTEAIELFGAKINGTSLSDIDEVWQNSGFYFFDAHWCKNIHDLSHLLMMETINHVAGPMSVPISADTSLTKVMGVNEKVEPSEIAKAYIILHQKLHQKIEGVVVIGGIDQNNGLAGSDISANLRQHIAVDEFSPFGTIVSLAYRDSFLGTYLLKPEDFGIELDFTKILIPNDRQLIHKANVSAIKGGDEGLADYLALNAALGIFAYRHLGKSDAIVGGKVNQTYLRQSFQEARSSISSGQAWKVLSNFVQATGGVVVEE